jgi:hypothetical protein
MNASAFNRLAPQVVRHRPGWQVQVADRHHVEYVKDDQVVSVPADLEGPVVRLHGALLTKSGTLNTDSSVVLSRFVRGLTLWARSPSSSSELRAPSSPGSWHRAAVKPIAMH